MPVWMISILTPIAASMLKLGIKMLGEKFIGPAAYLSLKEFAKTTTTDYDDKIAALIAEVWELDPKLLK